MIDDMEEDPLDGEDDGQFDDSFQPVLPVLTPFACSTLAFSARHPEGSRRKTGLRGRLVAEGEVIGDALDDVIGSRPEVVRPERLAARLGHAPPAPAHHQFFRRRDATQ